MTVLVGLVSPEERAKLEARGWEVQPIDLGTVASLYDCDPKDIARDPDDETMDEWVKIHVDSDLLVIMSGPDWDVGEDE